MEISEENNCEISCFKLPSDLLDKDIAKQYFKQFGRIIKMSIRLKSKSCTVLYADRNSAAHALAVAGKYEDETFFIRWAKAKDKLPTKKAKSPKKSDPDWISDPEVQAELAAMKELVPKSYNLRPEHMTVDSSESSSPLFMRTERSKQKKRVWEKTAMTTKVSDTSSPTLGVQKMTSDQIELYKLIKQQATTAEEKFRILEASDKLIRLRTKKQSDLTKATHTIGTCPDMCPEKERLMREAQHQVALYEQGIGGRAMNHTLAVKQYSRSSADQEVPLPHELRPVNVLHLTMGYLLHKIMDLCVTPGVNLAEWFHFLWDRTRAIRKDITQQELCCQGSVELVEQCARFHIHCSARLVAEEPSVFDQKINTENLTKCLQTLKYMYHDLALKNINCVNEAEFRAYIVLLNLNDGNFMWEVQNLSEHIKKSPQMRFSFQVYSALDKNNYVKFFKLVRSTTYLNACILLRYFNQVRNSAINLILKSYSPRTPTAFPVAELTNLLAFEDEDSTIDFMECYGLCTNGQKKVIFDRHSYVLPESPYSWDRAINIIESKRSCSVGETVCGKPLPPIDFEKHTLHNSFDSNGYLILSEYFSDIEMKSHEAVKQVDEREHYRSNSSVASSLSTNAPSIFTSQPQIKETNKSANIFSTVKAETILKPLIKESPYGSIFSASKASSMLNTDKDSAKTALTALDEKFSVEKIKEVPKRSLWEANKSTSIFKSTESPRTEQKTPSAPESFDFSQPFVLNEPRIFQPSQSKSTYTFQPPQSLLSVGNASKNVPEFKTQSIFASNKPDVNVEKDVSQNLFPMPSNEQIQKFKDEKKEEDAKLQRERKEEQDRKLEEKRQKQELLRREKEEEKLLLAKLLEAKKKQDHEMQQKKDLEMQQTVRDVVNIMVNIVTIVADLERDREETEKKLKCIHSKIKRRKLQIVINKWKRYVALKKRKRKIMEQSPIWLSNRSINEEAKELYMDSQNMTLHCAKRYKLGKSLNLVDVPQEKSLEKLHFHQLVHSILTKTCLEVYGKVQREIFWKVAIASKGKSSDVIDYIFYWKKVGNSTVAIEKWEEKFCTLTYCIEKYDEKKNDLNGLIYIIDDLDDQDDFDETNISVPIAVIIRDKSCEYDETTCGNRIFVDSIGSKQSLADTIANACKWLAKKTQISPPLELDILQSFLYQNLASELWQRILSCANRNFAFRKCLQLPNVAIQLHNEAVGRLQRLIFDDNALKHSSFPEEFKPFLKQEFPLWLPCNYRYFPSNWKSLGYKEALKDIIENLKLPSFEKQWPPKDNNLEVVIAEYCKKIFKNNDIKIFYKIMAVILKNISNDFENDIKNVLWSEIINVIAIEKIDSINYKYTKFPNIFGQYYIVYAVESLAKYKNEEWFYRNNSTVTNKIQNTLQMHSEDMNLDLCAATQKHSKSQMEDFDIDLDKAMEEAKNLPIKEKEEIAIANKQLSELQYLLDDLDKSMQIQKVISNRFEKTANFILNDQ